MKEFFISLHEDMVEWCKGRSWVIRLPVLIWFIYILINHLINPEYRSIMGWFNYWIHEAGHLVFLPFGEFLEAASGTLLECLIPIIFMIAFYRQKDFFGISFCFGWLATCFFYASWYMAEAQQTDDWRHDWFNMLSTMGILQYNRTMAFFVKIFGVVLMLISILSGFWLLWQMFRSRESTRDDII